MPRKNYNRKVSRIAFVKQCIDNPKQGSQILKNYAKKLNKSESSSEIIEILQDILFLSESTIYRDIGIY